MSKFKKLNEFFPLGAQQKLFYMQNPVAFIEDYIFKGTDYYLSDPQKIVLMSLVLYKRTSVSSGRGLGKSALAALAVIWFMVCFDKTKVALMSPSRQQLRNVLYSELDKWLSISPFRDSFELTKEHMYYRGDKGKHFCELVVARKDNPESVSGRHAQNMFFVIDEASNVNDKTLSYLDQSLTDVNNLMLMISNPTRTSGFFWESFHEHIVFGNKQKAKRWNSLKFSALQSPFVDAEDIERLRAYGEGSDQWRVSVLGEFPKGSADSFITLESIEQAVTNEIEFPSGPLRMGVDVAGSGTDLAVLCYSVGYKVYPLESKMRTDRADEYVVWVGEFCEELRRISGKPDEVVIVKVDDGGVGGHFVAEALKAVQQKLNIDVRPTTFGGAGDNHYVNNTARMFDNLKKIMPLLDLPNDRQMVEELSSRKYKVVASTGQEMSRIKIQTKDEWRSEFGHSPDKGDAVLLCMFDAKNPRTVLKDFNPSDRGVILDSISYVGGMDQYISLYYSRDGLSSSVWTQWDGTDLIITKTLITDDNIARVASEIKHSTINRTEKIVGNDRCFGASGQDIKSQLRKYSISLQMNKKYDELGAMNFLNMLVANKRLKIHNSCDEVATQLSEWRKDTTNIKQEVDYGLCYAILNIASELKQRVEREEKKPMFNRGYSVGDKPKAKPWEKAYGW